MEKQKVWWSHLAWLEPFLGSLITAGRNHRRLGDLTFNCEGKRTRSTSKKREQVVKTPHRTNVTIWEGCYVYIPPKECIKFQTFNTIQTKIFKTIQIKKYLN